MQKNVVVIFVDRFMNKNILQNNIFKKISFNSFWFVNYKSAEQAENIIALRSSFFARLSQILKFLNEHKHEIHHVEIYPGGRFSFVYSLIARWHKIKIICVERGDLLYYKPKKSGGYGFMTKFSMYVSYKLADIVWYKEPYMLERLKRIGVKETVFIHNSVKENDYQAIDQEIDFLWVNRVIPERQADWFAENLKNKAFAGTNNLILGILNTSGQYSELESRLIKTAPANLKLHNYAPPVEFFKKSKFFVLPASIVFANNALLEAMSYGVVPLVSATQSSGLIVEDGVNGFIFDHDPDSFLKAMIRAINMPAEQYREMSRNAKLKIQHDFSEQYFFNSISTMYRKFEKRQE